MAMACNVPLNPQHWILQERLFPFLDQKIIEIQKILPPEYQKSPDFSM